MCTETDVTLKDKLILPEVCLVVEDNPGDGNPPAQTPKDPKRRQEKTNDYQEEVQEWVTPLLSSSPLAHLNPTHTSRLNLKAKRNGLQ